MRDAPMQAAGTDRESYLQGELDRIFREWSGRTALAGALIFLALSPLDFFSAPDLARRFLAYRVAGTAALVLCALGSAPGAEPAGDAGLDTSWRSRSRRWSSRRWSSPWAGTTLPTRSA